MSKFVIVKVTINQYIMILTALLIDIFYIIRATQLEFEEKMYGS